MGARENKCQISQNDILHMKFSKYYFTCIFTILVKFDNPRAPHFLKKKIKLGNTHFLIKGIFLTVLKNIESAPGKPF